MQNGCILYIDCMAKYASKNIEKSTFWGCVKGTFRLTIEGLRNKIKVDVLRHNSYF